MSGFMMIITPCWGCGRPISCNPDLVPSLRDAKGVRQAICESCVGEWNKARADAHMSTFVIPAGAYEPMEVV